MSETGKRIKQRRKELGLSADKLAERLGVSRSTIFRYEKGEIEKVPAESLQKIADLLNTTPATLMGWDDFKKTPEHKKLLNRSNGADGLLSILTDIYGYAKSKSIDVGDNEMFYYLIGLEDKSFAISEPAFENLYKMVETIIPYYIDAVKTTEREEINDCLGLSQLDFIEKATTIPTKIIPLAPHSLDDDSQVVIAAHNDNEDPDQYELMMQDAADLLDDD